jgi:hypothetical protein
MGKEKQNLTNFYNKEVHEAIWQRDAHYWWFEEGRKGKVGVITIMSGIVWLLFGRIP